MTKQSQGEEKLEGKDYNFFNGRRSADKYVKAYLKGVLAVSSIGVAVILGFGSWAGVSIMSLQTRVSVIESSRFTTADGAKLLERVNGNSMSFVKIESKLDNILEDINEFKSILKRTSPFERKDELRQI